MSANLNDRTQKSALMQVSSLALIPENAKKTIDAFLQQSGEDVEGLAATAPEANGYEFQSSGVVEMLEKLLDN